MIDILPMLETRWLSILAGRTFDDPAGGTSTMRVFKMGLQPKRKTAAQGHDFPFTEISVRSGSDRPGKSTFLVDVVTGIYVNPDTDADGDIDADDTPEAVAQELLGVLASAMRELAAAPESYPGYALDSIKWQIGDGEGNHPGPDLYVVAAVLEFQQAFVL